MKVEQGTWDNIVAILPGERADSIVFTKDEIDEGTPKERVLMTAVNRLDKRVRELEGKCS